jgi:hypothetical protein
MSEKLETLLEEFIIALEQSALDYDFNSLSQDEQVKAKREMKQYIDYYFQ